MPQFPNVVLTSLLYWCFWMAQFHRSVGAERIIFAWLVLGLIVMATVAFITPFFGKDATLKAAYSYTNQPKFTQWFTKTHRVFWIMTLLYYGWMWSFTISLVSIGLAIFTKHWIVTRATWYTTNPESE